MHLVMNDFLCADTLEFTVPVTPLSRGMTHASMEENLKAVCNSIHIELMSYGNQQRHLVRERRIGHDANGAEVEEIHEHMVIKIQAK